jgi:hypothetical protein
MPPGLSGRMDQHPLALLSRATCFSTGIAVVVLEGTPAAAGRCQRSL